MSPANRPPTTPIELSIPLTIYMIIECRSCDFKLTSKEFARTTLSAAGREHASRTGHVVDYEKTVRRHWRPWSR